MFNINDSLKVHCTFSMHIATGAKEVVPCFVILVIHVKEQQHHYQTDNFLLRTCTCSDSL